MSCSCCCRRPAPGATGQEPDERLACHARARRSGVRGRAVAPVPAVSPGARRAGPRLRHADRARPAGGWRHPGSGLWARRADRGGRRTHLLQRYRRSARGHTRPGRQVPRPVLFDTGRAADVPGRAGLGGGRERRHPDPGRAGPDGAAVRRQDRSPVSSWPTTIWRADCPCRAACSSRCRCSCAATRRPPAPPTARCPRGARAWPAWRRRRAP